MPSERNVPAEHGHRLDQLTFGVQRTVRLHVVATRHQTTGAGHHQVHKITSVLLPS
jgi:hypothetical protein